MRQRVAIWGLIVSVVILLVFFIGGGYAAYTNQFNQEKFIFIATVVGGVMGGLGLLGLISVAKKPFAMKDLGQEQAEMLERLLATTKQAREYEAKALATKEEVDRLNAERAKVELLVRQATLKILLEEKLKVVAEEIEDRVDRDNRLSELMASYEVIKEQVIAVNGELKESGRASEVQKILDEVHQRGWEVSPLDQATGVTFVNAVVAEAVRDILYSVPLFGPITRRLEQLMRRRRKQLKANVRE